jgi:hypothetical protein
MSQQDSVSPVTAGRLAALGGLGFAVASIAGDLVIGPVPGPATPPAQLVPFYTFSFLLMAALAGLAARAVPRWLAWPALLLAVLSLLPGPFGFLASMVFLAWTAAAGITLLVAHQPRPQFARATTVPAKEVRHA